MNRYTINFSANGVWHSEYFYGNYLFEAADKMIEKYSNNLVWFLNSTLDITL